MIELNEKISKTKIQIGEKYGRLLIISRLNDIKDNSGHRHAYFKCKCDCGNEKNLIGDYIGKSVFSCGCLQSEKVSEIKRKHNIHNTFIYNSYKSMISRCYSPNFKGYSDYGGRGITVCREWYNPLYTDGYDPICVLNFYNWAINNPTYKDGYTLDRIDPNGNYCPENCRWADSNIQANNKRTSKYIIYNGEKQTVTNWDKIRGYPNGTISHRLKRGWTIDEALSIYSPESKLNCKQRLINGIYFIDDNGTYVSEEYAENMLHRKEKINITPSFNNLIDK